MKKESEKILELGKNLWKKISSLVNPNPLDECPLAPLEKSSEGWLEGNERILIRYRGLLEEAISSEQLLPEQKLQLLDSISDLERIRLKLKAGLALALRRMSNEGKKTEWKESLMEREDTIRSLVSEFNDKVIQEISDSYPRFQEKFIEAYGETSKPVVIILPSGERMTINSSSGQLYILDSEGIQLSPSVKSVRVILKALEKSYGSKKEETGKLD